MATSDAEPIEGSSENAQESEQSLLNEFLDDLKQRHNWKSRLRASNQNVDGRPDDSFFHKLDSSLKKNTAFVRKMKSFSEVQKDAIVKEMNSLNLTKYIGEVAAAIVEAKLKMNDLPAIIEICSLLHQRYSEFSSTLLSAWQKVLSLKRDEKITNSSKLRVDLKCYADLISVGLFHLKDSLPLLGSLLTTLVTIDKEEHAHLSIILMFCKQCGDEYAGIIPRKMRILAEKYGKQIPKPCLLPQEKQRNVKQMLRDYFTTVCNHVLKEHAELLQVERTNRKLMMTRGEVHPDRLERAQSLQSAFSKLLANADVLADLLDEDLPELPKEDPKKKEVEFEGFQDEGVDSVIDQSNGAPQIWEDDDMKNFYEGLVDLCPIVPAILYKDTLQAKKSVDSTTDPKAPDQSAKVAADEEIEDEELDDVIDNEEISPPDIYGDDAEDNDSQNTSTKMLFEAYLANLTNCVNREMIDQAAAEFCLSFNTKNNRKKLVKTLFTVHRNRLDLLPFYARFVATLNPLIPDIATDLGQYLKQEFRWLVKKKDQMKIESKVKVCRFIGELVKFNIFPKQECLYCIKQLLNDFSHHHIDMACTFIEVCGRFLYYSPDSHMRTKICLDQMMRRKVAVSMDARYIMLIENAYYCVNPSDMQADAKPKKPAIEQYIEKILYTDLTRSSCDAVIKHMRKLPWNNPQESIFAVKLISEVWKFKYYNIRYAASMLAGLTTYQSWVGTTIIDGLLEDIRLMMEINLPKFNQRRISSVKFLAEMYNYRLVDSSIIFKVLYSLITFGCEQEEPSFLDPPDHLLRIRLVCVILETCGSFMTSSTNKKKLDYFIIFFQQYYLRKRCSDLWDVESNPFPFTISGQYEETLTLVRPKMKLMATVQEADEAVEKIRKEMLLKIMEKAPQVSNLLSKLSISDGSSTHPGGSGLQTIGEDEEDDEDGHSTSRSRSASQVGPIEGDDGDEDDDEDDGDEETDSEESDSQDEDEMNEEGIEDTSNGRFHIPSAPKHIPCQEDDEFVALFDKMLNENITEGRTRQAGGIVVPPAQGRHLKKTYEQLQRPETPPNTVQFSVLLRKGAKPAYKEISVASDSDIAINLQKQEEADRLEKERVKRLTLEMNERQEEEDLNEAIAAMQRPLNMLGRGERKFRPKGTPDAEAIFGSKKVKKVDRPRNSRRDDDQ